jgi:hypothetical protein
MGMTNTTEVPTAAELVKAVQARIANMIERADGDGQADFVEREVALRYAAVVRSLAVWAIGPRAIRCEVSDTPDAHIWGDGLTTEALDAPAVSDPVFETGVIGEFGGGTYDGVGCTLTW